AFSLTFSITRRESAAKPGPNSGRRDRCRDAVVPSAWHTYRQRSCHVGDNPPELARTSPISGQRISRFLISRSGSMTSWTRVQRRDQLGVLLRGPAHAGPGVPAATAGPAW